MKKVVMLALAAMLSCGSWMAMNATTTEKTAVEMTAGYKITIYKLTDTLTITRKGTYDPENQTLTTSEGTFKVRSNPRQNDGTKYGRYAYCAGPFYFNL